tara:strand:- start:12320 stop:13867 length:1548 start_codon:yes stop_codon:yes gene_type:complete
MAKTTKPKAYVSSEGDLITVVQNGVEKHITKKDLLSYLDNHMSQISADIKSVKRHLNRKTIDKDAPNFRSAISAGEPLGKKHLTTKNYVDHNLKNVVRSDGTTPLIKNLSYRRSPEQFGDNDVVTKKFVDDNLKSTLKAVKRYASTTSYPAASSGDSFVITHESNAFAEDGPEVQTGDLIVCIEDSMGGTHSQVGDQFAILNTNVVFSTEDQAGILKVASDEDIKNLDSSTSALTPLKYKRALELNSEYNRTVVKTPTYTLTEDEKGIIGVMSSQGATTITLPTIGRLKNPKLVKYIIKDESGQAAKNTITILSSGGDTIQGSRSFILSTNNESLKLYTDGESKWYVEGNVSSGTGGGSGVKTFSTVDLTNGERAVSTGAYESVMAIDVDLREYPLGSGFKIIAHSFFAANSNTKTVAIGVDGTQVIPSSNTGTTAPNGLFCHHEVTVLHSDTAQYMAFGFCLVGADMAADGSAAGLTNNLDLDWNSKITVSVDVNAATAVTDIKVYALQVVPLK